jgi:hypothetical protein
VVDAHETRVSEHQYVLAAQAFAYGVILSLETHVPVLPHRWFGHFLTFEAQWRKRFERVFLDA